MFGIYAFSSGNINKQENKGIINRGRGGLKGIGRGVKKDREPFKQSRGSFKQDREAFKQDRGFKQDREEFKQDRGFKQEKAAFKRDRSGFNKDSGVRDQFTKGQNRQTEKGEKSF